MPRLIISGDGSDTSRRTSPVVGLGCRSIQKATAEGVGGAVADPHQVVSAPATPESLASPTFLRVSTEPLPSSTATEAIANLPGGAVSHEERRGRQALWGG